MQSGKAVQKSVVQKRDGLHLLLDLNLAFPSFVLFPDLGLLGLQELQLLDVEVLHSNAI